MVSDKKPATFIGFVEHCKELIAIYKILMERRAKRRQPPIALPPPKARRRVSDCSICYGPEKGYVCVCGLTFCTACLKHLLTETNATPMFPACPSCKKEWNYESLHSIKSLGSHIKKHFETVLFKQQKLLLPTIQSSLETKAHKKRQDYYSKIQSVIFQKLVQFYKRFAEKTRIRYEICPQHNCIGVLIPHQIFIFRCHLCSYKQPYQLQGGPLYEFHVGGRREEGVVSVNITEGEITTSHKRPGFVSNYVEFLREFILLQKTSLSAARSIQVCENVVEEVTDPQKPTRKCPGEGCHGFLHREQAEWKCGLCSLHLCRVCEEPMVPNHQCAVETVRTLQHLHEHARPCPTCGQWIVRSSGCPQMWCVMCHHAFDWETGEPIQGIVHNPHYFDWRARQPRNHQECLSWSLATHDTFMDDVQDKLTRFFQPPEEHKEEENEFEWTQIRFVEDQMLQNEVEVYEISTHNICRCLAELAELHRMHQHQSDQFLKHQQEAYLLHRQLEPSFKRNLLKWHIAQKAIQELFTATDLVLNATRDLATTSDTSTEFLTQWVALLKQLPSLFEVLRVAIRKVKPKGISWEPVEGPKKLQIRIGVWGNMFPLHSRRGRRRVRRVPLPLCF